MNKLFLLLSFVAVFGCQPTDEPTDAAARAAGNYAVKLYIVDGDTLLSAGGINKPGWNNYHIDVKRVGPDSVSVIKYYIKDGVSCGFGSPATVKQVGNKLQLSSRRNAPDVYESTIVDGMFYERTVGMNVDSLKKRWDYDSLKSPYVIYEREVTIFAAK